MSDSPPTFVLVSAYSPKQGLDDSGLMMSLNRLVEGLNAYGGTLWIFTTTGVVRYENGSVAEAVTFSHWSQRLFPTTVLALNPFLRRWTRLTLDRVGGDATYISYLVHPAALIPRGKRSSSVIVGQDVAWRMAKGRLGLASGLRRRTGLAALVVFSYVAELWLYRQFRAVTFVSDIESKWARRSLRCNAVTVSLGVDVGPLTESEPGPIRLANLGSYRPPQMYAAARRLLQIAEVAAIQPSVGRVACRYIGPNLPASAPSDLASSVVDVELFGWADDLADAFSGVDLLVVDPPYATGIKTSVLAALAHGVPVACNKAVAAALPSGLAAFVYTFDNHTEAAEVVARVALNSEEAFERARSARQYLSESMKWETYAPAVVAHARAC